MAEDSQLIDNPLLCGIDQEERIILFSSRAEWEVWMEERGKKLRGLVKDGGVAVGIRFLGEQAGWGKSKSPLLWQGALLVNKRSVVTVHGETFDEAYQKIIHGLTSVTPKAPWMIWVRLKKLILILKWKKNRFKQEIFKKI